MKRIVDASIQRDVLDPADLRIPDYTLLREIGAGAYGRVFLAQDSVGRYRAIKVIHRSRPTDDPAYDRELRGLRLFAEISQQDKGLISIFHVGRLEAEECFYYVMELADPVPSAAPFDPQTYSARSLQTDLEARGALRPAECIRIGRALSGALSFMHRRGLVHRDIKPANVVFVDGQPRLADIGLVSTMDPLNSLVGTPSYMDVATHGTAQGDIYGLGRVLYEISTGYPASRFPAAPTLQGSDHRLFLELNEVLLQAGVKDPEHRYQSMDQLHAHLTLLDSGESLRHSMQLVRWWRQLRRYTPLALLMVGLIVLSVWQWAAQSRQESELRQRRVGRSLAYGTRALDNQDFLEALPWFVEALRSEEADPRRSLNHRLRIGSTLADSPRLIQLSERLPGGFKPLFTPDGRGIITADATGTAGTLDLGSGQFHPFAGFSPARTAEVICFSRDGAWQISTNTAGEVLLARTAPLDADKRLLAAGEPRAGWIATFGTVEGSIALAHRTAGLIRVLDPRLPSRGITLDQPGVIVQNLRLDRGSQRLALATRSNGVMLINLTTGHRISSFTNHTSWVFGVAFSPEGDRVASVSYDRTLRVWRSDNAQELIRISHGGAVGDVDFSPDGSRLVTSATDNQVRVFDAHTGRLVGPPLPHESKVVHVGFSGRNDSLFSASLNGLIRVWSTGNSPTAPASPSSLTVSDSGRSLAWIEEGTVRWSGSRTHPPAVPVRCDATGLQGVTFNGSGSRLAVLERAPKGATSAALQAQVWDVEHGSPVGDRFLVKGEGAVVALDGAGMLLASADGNRLVIQETTHGRVVGVWEFPGRSVASLIWHPNRGLLAVDLEIELRLYDIGRSAQAWAAPVRLPMPLSKVAFSPDGRSLATACSDRSVLPGEARIWEVASGEPITPPLRHKDGVLSLAFSPDGATIATASEDFTALLWEVRTGRSVGRPFRHPDEVADVSFDEQGKWLATACRDGKARVWDLETNEPLIPGFSHPSRLFKVRFGPDRASLITETGEGLRTQWALTFDHRPADYLYRLARLLAPESAAFEDTVAPANSARLKAEYDALTARALP